MGKVIGNFNIDECSKTVYDFIIKYKTIILITFFIGVVVNAVDVFTIKFGVDSELYTLENSPQIYFDTQRYGSWLLYYLLPFARYHIISQLTGLFVLTIASLLTISRHNISNNAKLLFMVLFITYPNFAFLQYFYFQSAYNFMGLLFTVIAYRLIEKNNIIAYIIAVVLLFIGISSYQANAAVFLSVMMINVILEYINEKNIKQAIICIFKAVLFLVLSLVIYYILIKIFAGNFNSFHSSSIRYQSNIIDNIGSLITYLYRILISYADNSKHTANIVVSIILIISFIYILIKHYKEKYYLFLILLVIGFIFAFLSLNIFLGGFITVRAEIANGFYPAFILMLVYVYSSKLKLLIYVIAVCIVFYHACYIAQCQISYYMTYKQDETTAKDIISKIYNKYPEILEKNYKINIIGIMKKNTPHPLLKSSGIFEVSFFKWVEDQRRMVAFMKLHGLPMDVKLGKITDNMKKEIKTMPSYPSNDCVKLIGDTVVVKLSD